MYGLGTRSYNRSPERREMKRQCEEATKNFETGPRNEVEILLCHCLSFRFAHKPSEHKRLMSDYDWRAWDQRRNMQVYEDHVR